MSLSLLYKDIKALNRDNHKNLKLKQSGDCGFAANSHLVPVAGIEFFQVARHYPIVFIGNGEELMPVALLGLKSGENSFLTDDQHWVENMYIPAFIRRYPFVLAQEKNEQFTVCFDAAHSGWNEAEGRALFDEKGENSDFLLEMIQFLQNFTAEMERTRHFVAKLIELDLLQNRTLKLQHTNGESFVLSDFKAVDEEKFFALNDEQVLELHKTGFFAWVYAHLLSQGNANDLFARHLKAKNEAVNLH